MLIVCGASPYGGITQLLLFFLLALPLAVVPPPDPAAAAQQPADPSASLLLAFGWGGQGSTPGCFHLRLPPAAAQQPRCGCSTSLSPLVPARFLWCGHLVECPAMIVTGPLNLGS